ncbi:MAG TPA: D-amino acid dehydrogenase [Paenalcaligenes sp.]|nr:D-amino acid dehydrogenase [Paenalcaligenes sp.]
MTHIAVIGAGITGVTTAYALQKRGFQVTVIDRLRYPAMDTSFANGGQLSACNAEVWNNLSTMLKGVRWMLRKDAPLLFNPSPSWHKYSWMAEFAAQTRNYEKNTIATAKMAIAAREHLFQWAKDENIDFDLVEQGILHIYQSKAGFESGLKVSKLLAQAGLERSAVTPEEIPAIEPTLKGKYYGGFFTPSDATGDIHKYTRGLAKACEGHGVKFIFDAHIHDIAEHNNKQIVHYQSTLDDKEQGSLQVDKVVISAGVGSRHLARLVGDRMNVYPVKGYSITVHLDDEVSQQAAPWVSLLDEEAKIVTSRLGTGRLRIAGTAEYNGINRDIRADRIEPLERWCRYNFEQAGTYRVDPWAGLRPMMPDMMPRVQKGSRQGIFYNTGHGHLGWTLSAITAEMLADLVQAES